MSRGTTFEKAIKPLAIEEFFDYYFYRRVAHFLVPIFIRFKVTPNQVSTLSLITGLSSAYLFYRHHFILSGLMALTAIFFDCCDGQVARLTGQSSPMGRIMDGFFDAIWITALWFAIHLSGYFQTHGLEKVAFPIMVVSSLSMFGHVWRFDAAKIKYLEMAGTGFNEGDLDVHEAMALCQKELKRWHLFTALLALVIAFQMYFFVRGNQKKQVYHFSDQQKRKIQTELEPVINLWSWLGEGHHNTLVILGILLAPWSPYPLLIAFVVIMTVMNLWWIHCERIFSTKVKDLMIKGEV